MLRRALGAALAVVGTMGLPAMTGRAQQPLDRVIDVFPSEVHVGDTLYIGGQGFEPSKPGRLVHEVFSVGCPNPPLANGRFMFYQFPTPSRKVRENNWTTDSHGRFAGWTLPVVPKLGSGLDGPITCTVYASYGGQYLGADFPGHFVILPQNRILDRCSRHMCVNVSAPKRVRIGKTQHVEVDAWPGAVARVTITLGSSSVAWTRHMNWLGETLIAWQPKSTQSASAKTLKATVHVRAQLDARVTVRERQVVVVR